MNATTDNGSSGDHESDEMHADLEGAEQQAFHEKLKAELTQINIDLGLMPKRDVEEDE